MAGIDIYDTVLILNTEAAVQQFAHPRVRLGAELSVAAGPVGDGRSLEASRAASWSYVKSKGFYAGIQLDGTVIIERNDENARFYGQKIKAADLLAGQGNPQDASEGLYQTLAAAEGRTGVPTNRIPQGVGPSEAHHKVDDTMLSPDGKPPSSLEAPPGYEEAVSSHEAPTADTKSSY